MLNIQDKLYDIMNMQIDMWSKDYPYLKDTRNEILEMVKVEEEKFENTIKRGGGMVKRISTELKAKGKDHIPVETLTELYDSHGLPPEIVMQAAEKEDIKIEVPDNFYALIAQRHMEVSKPVEEETTPEKRLREAVKGLPPTEPLYYQDQYMKQFEAAVLKVIEKEFIVLDRTCFFPEGGGQPADTGHIKFDDKKTEVIDVQKIGRVIVHKLKGSVPKEGGIIKGTIDWNKRYSLMKNHTATHVVGGAARRVLGQHVWQFGTQKGVESSRLDISHYRRLTLEELQKMETLANGAILSNIQVDTAWMPRNEAENQYGFRLYQGGAVPGKEIRIVKTGDWDVEACAGTHLKSTLEIGFLKIIHSEGVQDGVERLVYSIGIPAVKAVQRNDQLLLALSETLNAPVEKLATTAQKLVRELKEGNVDRRRLIKELAARESGSIRAKSGECAEEMNGITIVTRDFKEFIDVERMVVTANDIIRKNEATVTIFYGSDGKNARIMVLAGETAFRKGVNAGEVVRDVSKFLGGGGGGKPNFAQGGGTDIEKLAEAIRKAEERLKHQLGG
jgi:alanyl-tRNA synthetase